MLKLSVSPAELPRRGWIEAVRRVRAEVQEVLEDSPSLRREVPAIVARRIPRVALLVADLLDDGGELTPDLRARLRTADFAPDQVLGTWLPDAPG